jgi:hypothetical protein
VVEPDCDAPCSTTGRRRTGRTGRTIGFRLRFEVGNVRRGPNLLYGLVQLPNQIGLANPPDDKNTPAHVRETLSAEPNTTQTSSSRSSPSPTHRLPVYPKPLYFLSSSSSAREGETRQRLGDRGDYDGVSAAGEGGRRGLASAGRRLRAHRPRSRLLLLILLRCLLLLPRPGRRQPCSSFPRALFEPRFPTSRFRVRAFARRASGPWTPAAAAR